MQNIHILMRCLFHIVQLKNLNICDEIMDHIFEPPKCVSGGFQVPT